MTSDTWAAHAQPPDNDAPRQQRRSPGQRARSRPLRGEQLELTVVEGPVSPPRTRVCRRRPVGATVRIKVDFLRAEMESRGITGRDLAKEAGISEGTIYNALGARPILIRNAKLIAGALDRIAIEPALGCLVVSGRGVALSES